MLSTGGKFIAGVSFRCFFCRLARKFLLDWTLYCAAPQWQVSFSVYSILHSTLLFSFTTNLNLRTAWYSLKLRKCSVQLYEASEMLSLTCLLCSAGGGGGRRSNVQLYRNACFGERLLWSFSGLFLPQDNNTPSFVVALEFPKQCTERRILAAKRPQRSRVLWRRCSAS